MPASSGGVGSSGALPDGKPVPTFPGRARGATTPFPWSDVLRFGLGEMRLAPAAFWAMSLPELKAALEPPGGGAPAADLRALIHRYDTI